MVYTSNFNLVAAKVYPFTVQVKEFTPEPVTPWGKPTKGAKTRRKKASDKLIISRRKGK